MENNKKGTFKVPHKIDNLDADYGGWSSVAAAKTYFDTKGEAGRQFTVTESGSKVLYIYQGPNQNPTKVGSNNEVTINPATSTTAGIVKLSSDSVSNLVPNNISTTASRTYGIQKNDSGQLVVNVPWSYNIASITDLQNKTTEGKLYKGEDIVNYFENRVSNYALATNWSNTNQRMSALPDKSSDVTYNKMLIANSNGMLATTPTIRGLINAVSRMTTSERELYITALGASGDGVVYLTSTQKGFYEKGNVAEIIVIGNQITNFDGSSGLAWIENISDPSKKYYATEKYVEFGTRLRMIVNIPGEAPSGEYIVKTFFLRDSISSAKIIVYQASDVSVNNVSWQNSRYLVNGVLTDASTQPTVVAINNEKAVLMGNNPNRTLLTNAFIKKNVVVDIVLEVSFDAIMGGGWFAQKCDLLFGVKSNNVTEGVPEGDLGAVPPKGVLGHGVYRFYNPNNEPRESIKGQGSRLSRGGDNEETVYPSAGTFTHHVHIESWATRTVYTLSVPELNIYSAWYTTGEIVDPLPLYIGLGGHPSAVSKIEVKELVSKTVTL